MTAWTHPISEEDLHGFVDGSLDPERRADVETYLREAPDAVERVRRRTEEIARPGGISGARTRAPIGTADGATMRRRMLTCAALIGLAGAAPAEPGDAGFLTDSHAAMDQMMAAMAAPPSGSVDQDFVAMMVPHHQGAIDMARAELRYGHDELLRRIAQEIIIEQQQEIVAMRLVVSDPLPASAPSPDQPAGHHHMTTTK